MPRFQIRYSGEGAPDPETLLAQDAAEALTLARSRFAAVAAERAVLWADGAMIQVFVPGEGGPPDNGLTLVEQLASKGVYVLDPFRTPKP